jgi:hypothetical protein
MAITQIPAHSANYTKGRTQAIREIILHVSQSNIEFLHGYFSRPNERQVSSHYAISKVGGFFQYVADSDTAHHARQANPWSIGIEHEGVGEEYQATETQLKASIMLCAHLCKKYSLDPAKAIKRHRDYVATLCPVGLQVEEIIEGVQEKLYAEPKPPKSIRYLKIYKDRQLLHELVVPEGKDVITRSDKNGNVFVDVRE